METRKRQKGKMAITKKYEIEPASIGPSSRKKSIKLLKRILNEKLTIAFPIF